MQPNYEFGATLQFGPVAAVDDGKHAVRVRLPALENMETDWLPVVSLAAGSNRFYALPDPGELAVCLLDARGEGGVCLGVVYNAADATPAGSRDVWMKEFTNGTVISHDRASGQVTVDTPGEVLIKSGVKVTIDCAETETTGDLLVSGSLTFMQGITGYGSGNGGATAVIHGTVRTHNGNVEVVDGDVLADNISLKQHTHKDLSSGGDTGPAQ